MSENDEADVLQVAAAAHVQAAPRQHRLKTPACPPMTRFAAPELPNWSAEESAHVEFCAYCQKIVTMRFREDCPAIGDLIRYRAGATIYRTAIEAHLGEERGQRCRTILESSWMKALAGGWLAAAPLAERVAQWARDTAIASAAVALQPSFAAPSEAPAFRITAGDAAGSMLATLINERSEAVLYVEARGEGKGKRRAYVDLSGPKGRLGAVVELEQTGKSATGLHRFGSTSDVIQAVGEEITLFVGLEPPSQG